MVFLKILLLGWFVLLGAVVFNYAAVKIGLIGWYEFLQSKSSLKPQDIVWLFVLYPLLLGFVVFLSLKVIKL